MTIESYIIDYLAEELDPISVSGDVPEPAPVTFVTVEQTGSSRENRINHATIAIQSWGSSRATAMGLNDAVKASMLSITDKAEISACRLNTDYNYPHTSTRHPRYQAIFEVVYYL